MSIHSTTHHPLATVAILVPVALQQCLQQPNTGAIGSLRGVKAKSYSNITVQRYGSTGHPAEHQADVSNVSKGLVETSGKTQATQANLFPQNILYYEWDYIMGFQKG